MTFNFKGTTVHVIFGAYGLRAWWTESNKELTDGEMECLRRTVRLSDAVHGD